MEKARKHIKAMASGVPTSSVPWLQTLAADTSYRHPLGQIIEAGVVFSMDRRYE